MRVADEALTEETPTLGQVVLDCPDPRELAEFYRRMFGLQYRAGDEPPPPDEPDPKGQDWLVLRGPGGSMGVAFQGVAGYAAPTWPEGPRPQMLHLDTFVSTIEGLYRQRDRALALGARQLLDRSDDQEEPLFVLADPAGHPFCVFVG